MKHSSWESPEYILIDVFKLLNRSYWADLDSIPVWLNRTVFVSALPLAFRIICERLSSRDRGHNLFSQMVMIFLPHCVLSLLFSQAHSYRQAPCLKHKECLLNKSRNNNNNGRERSVSWCFLLVPLQQNFWKADVKQDRLQGQANCTIVLANSCPNVNGADYMWITLKTA